MPLEFTLRVAVPVLLADIARGMMAYFNSAEVNTNMTSAVVHVLVGLLPGASLLALMVATAHPPYHPSWR